MVDPFGIRPHLGVIARALAAAGILVATTTAFAAIRDGYFATGATALGLRGLARALQTSLLHALPDTILLGALAAAGRKLRSPAVVAVAALAMLVVGVLLATFRLPYAEYYAPRPTELRGLLAFAGALVAAAVAAWILAGRPPARAVRVVAGAFVLAALVSLLVRYPLGSSPAGAPDPARPNVILISLDTVRADRLGCYGYGRPTTPEIDRFAERAMRFTRAFAHHPATLTSHMTMMTSLLPIVHGVTSKHGLPPEAPTLAEVLHGAGYRTIGVADRVPWLDAKYGFGRGFDVYRQVFNEADLKIDRILTHLRDLDRQPFFLFAHFYDAHSDWGGLPYTSSDEDRAEFAGWYTGEFQGCEGDLCATDWMHDTNQRGLDVAPERIAWLSSLYDAGLRTLDRKLGRLFRELESRGILDSSVVILTADHGEEFREHGHLLHTQHYDECLHVPLLVRTPRTIGGSSDVLARTLDVMPTLLELAGLEPRGQGRSLAPVLAGAEPRAPVEDVPQVIFDATTGLVGLRSERWSLLRDGRWSAYDVAADPAQKVDLARDGRVPGEAQPLIDVFEREETRLSELGKKLCAKRPDARLSEQDRKDLEALGYAGE